ncbi:DUF4422 domain-containing protein [Pelagibacterales bacterium SAG-MED19]|nr:DUF4422 domain-containing protein [Pelagibacterales bacterium SAG-MED19]
MKNIKFYCVTNKPVNFLNNPCYNLAWVGKNDSPPGYIKCNNGENIFYKEQYYSELTFHYWYWKNLLGSENSDDWIGFCQRRRYLVKENANQKIDINNINKNLLIEFKKEWHEFESLICNPIQILGAKKIKILKRGWKNILKDPSILFNEKKQNISFHFDMHHGYGNLDKAIMLLENEDRDDFEDYVKTNIKFNPHIMFVSKKEIIDKWFNSLFPWLERCEKKFGFENLKGYDMQRIYAYLAERYLSFWFKKYTHFKEQPWAFIEN